jgi:DNA-binding XRE family transcriptional regulator
MAVAFAMILFTWLIRLAGLAVSVYIVVLLVRVLKKYLESSGGTAEHAQEKKSLGETLKKYRTKNSMTQEFVAESLGVSRQAVSKWENGTADPSTSNLLKLAKLYGITPEELIRAVQPQQE